MNKVFPALAATIALAAIPATASADIVTPCPAGTDPALAQAVQWLATQTATPVSCIPVTAAQIAQIAAANAVPAVPAAAPATVQAQPAAAAAPAPRIQASKLHAGQFCTRAKQRTYRHAGYTCRKASDGRYRLRRS